MSKFVKDLLTKEISSKLDGVSEAVLVNVIGLSANDSVALRKELRAKDIQLVAVKNSLARRATEGTPLALAFENCEGAVAVMWGAEDIVSLAKEATRLSDDEENFVAFQTRGGVMDGEAISPERIKEISKWPTRTEQLSMLAGQLLGPGSELAAALLGPGKTLASQIKSKSEE